ncbi:CDP-glycerol glycerophosphotransferase family protein (plasmid) [Enterobacter roggenkampii]|uniref:CDP-glycerol glycerophosphotransferase family protein n=1 Tax=Enterobacteriaceae TaxID=543 RepID=UPI000774A40D|nr:CDP-glycerol glycerophosphotransferase family protein [Kluyvera cryocrescens]
MFKRKLQKLIRDPKLFFSDMAIKQGKKIGVLKPKKNNGHFQYTVVSAVYNVGRYLEDYFKSIIEQRLDFCKHIHLILVDDGSTDNSAEIIKKWQVRFPNNITYIFKENGGQASARNLGMQSVKTEWVTFIDPDDFVDIDYFHQIDNLMYKNGEKNLSMLSCNFIFYIEDKNTYSNTHPLNFRFKDGDKILPVMQMDKNPQLHVNSVIFKRDTIIENGILFDDRIKPNFEDGHFVANYILATQESSIAFCSKAKYFYRKRSDGSSSLDTSWEKIGKYTDVLEHGYLDLLEKYNKLGEVPKSIQWTVLYDLIWHFKRIVQHPEKLNILDENQKERYFNLIEQIFKFIDSKQIIEFNLGGAWFYHKVGLLGLFKNQEPPFQIVYAEQYDFVKNQVLLRYFSSQNDIERITIDDKDIIPDFAKTIMHDFVGRTFCYERRLWVHLPDGAKEVRVDIGSVPTKLSLGGRQSAKGISVKDLKGYFKTSIPKFEVDTQFSGAWIFMDRDVQADDNAEHLYRYVKNQYPDQNIFFVLREDSHDWERLEAENFNLINFGSDDHKKALQSCAKVISSHADHYVTNYLGKNMLKGRHFIFLQHGVTKDDLSAWLNSKEQIDCIITTSNPERNSLCANGTRYKFTEKEVALTGFPRHDLLLNNKEKKSNTILFMPTWRKNIIGNRISGGSEFEYNDEFVLSEFFKHWQSVLTSPYLKEIAEKHNASIVFFPHAYIQPYIELFTLPEHIKVMNHVNESMQKLFTDASILVTDYSSVAFEMAVQKKPVIYYQFDEETFFSGTHNYVKGYYDYREHGFGPVVMQESELFDALKTQLEHYCLPDDNMLARMDLAFPYQDGKNCERTYEAIIALDAPREYNFINVSLLIDYAQNASTSKIWSLAEERWQKVHVLYDEKHHACACMNLVTALRMQGKFEKAFVYLDESDAFFIAKNIPIPLESQLERVELYMAVENWTKAEQIWSQLQESRKGYRPLRHLNCLTSMADWNAILKLTSHPLFVNLPLHVQAVGYATVHKARGEWREVINKLSPILKNFDEQSLYELKPQLLLAHAYRELGMYDKADEFITKYEKLSKAELTCFYEIILLAAARGDFKKSVTLIDKMFVSCNDLPEALAVCLVQSLRQLGKYDRIDNIGSFLLTKYPNNMQLLCECGQVAILQKKWSEAISIWNKGIGKVLDAPYRLALAYRMNGQVEQGFSTLQQSEIRTPNDLEEWKLMAELAELTGHWDEAVRCWRGLIRYYPEIEAKEYWHRLSSTQMMLAMTQLSTLEKID